MWKYSELKKYDDNDVAKFYKHGEIAVKKKLMDQETFEQKVKSFRKKQYEKFGTMPPKPGELVVDPKEIEGFESEKDKKEKSKEKNKNKPPAEYENDPYDVRKKKKKKKTKKKKYDSKKELVNWQQYLPNNTKTDTVKVNNPGTKTNDKKGSNLDVDDGSKLDWRYYID